MRGIIDIRTEVEVRTNFLLCIIRSFGSNPSPKLTNIYKLHIRTVFVLHLIWRKNQSILLWSRVGCGSFYFPLIKTSFLFRGERILSKPARNKDKDEREPARQETAVGVLIRHF